MTADDSDSRPKSRVWHRVCVILGIIVCAAGICSGFLLLAATAVKDKAAQMSTQGKMNQLSLAAHNFNAASGGMPGPFLDGHVADHSIPDDPTRRLSWRVALLPYIEAHTLYFRLNRSEPWDSPTNRPVSSTHYRPLADTLDGQTTQTPFRVFYDNGALWDSNPQRRIALDKVPDGSSNTILIAESTVQVPWAQFNEHLYDPDGPLPELGRMSRNTFILAMADGSVRVVKKSVAPNILRAAITSDGSEQLPSDW